MSTPPLEYESAIAAGVVVCERSAAGICIQVPASMPDALMIRRLSNRAAIFAGWVTALLMIPFFCLLTPLIVPRGRWMVFPTLLLDLVLLFFALGIYCILWQANSKRRLLSLARSLRQSTEIRIDGNNVSIQSSGPFGSINRVVPSSSVRDVGVFWGYVAGGGMTSLLIRLADDSEIQILPDRGKGEYKIIVNALREALGRKEE